MMTEEFRRASARHYQPEDSAFRGEPTFHIGTDSGKLVNIAGFIDWFEWRFHARLTEEEILAAIYQENPREP